MKTHLTDEEVFEMAFDKLNVANPKVDKLHEIAQLMDLEFDEEKGLYHNPNCCCCGKMFSEIDLKYGKKTTPYLCYFCYTTNA